MFFSSSTNPKTKDKEHTECTEKINALTEKNRELRAVYNALDHSLAIIEFDTEGKILNANDNFLKIIGYTLEEIRGKHHSMLCDPKLVSSNSYSDFWHKLRSGQFQQKTFKRIKKGARRCI
ncbi:hypothetical protein NHP190003_04460 [Helicobacter sp. NHP19-003]|uniref:PAS domain-containing protein n=1 Tax=Helicobacter gastrocanis TaxID=2849641 RepID=A0ABN6I3V8_9HELI|nr:PAS domain S-box protein [Helicobacter sp. NHP19-003]BCZ17164.1 hypothetical protein NHP190003_04460 [Helicobacter sp. NHP19-003]